MPFFAYNKNSHMSSPVQNIFKLVFENDITMKKAIILTLIVFSIMLFGCADDYVPAQQGKPQVSGGKVAFDFDPNASINLTEDELETQVGLEEVDIN